MKIIKIKTPSLELEVQDVPPWLVLVVIAAGVILLVSGVWVWT